MYRLARAISWLPDRALRGRGNDAPPPGQPRGHRLAARLGGGGHPPRQRQPRPPPHRRPRSRNGRERRARDPDPHRGRVARGDDPPHEQLPRERVRVPQPPAPLDAHARDGEGVPPARVAEHVPRNNRARRRQPPIDVHIVAGGGGEEHLPPAVDAVAARGHHKRGHRVGVGVGKEKDGGRGAAAHGNLVANGERVHPHCRAVGECHGRVRGETHRRAIIVAVVRGGRGGRHHPVVIVVVIAVFLRGIPAVVVVVAVVAIVRVNAARRDGRHGGFAKVELRRLPRRVALEARLPDRVADRPDGAFDPVGRFPVGQRDRPKHVERLWRRPKGGNAREPVGLRHVGGQRNDRIGTFAHEVVRRRARVPRLARDADDGQVADHLQVVGKGKGGIAGRVGAHGHDEGAAVVRGRPVDAPPHHAG
ncbi:hypothetical protein BU14_0256s0021 [Porphyra umbilicalis]|uniref:Uncharacterized protein n=1 Tax=Porphyra umbilicalis TaxID=2786 RepID=A0A1X6P2J0_PORUM|nr:hypothetical protein BU14_0256s0021 [Porphyra umbilicalis]|eukprot:OSX75068.1 hypothetical protein BU14_0256s0021 [Porphyra umbilicalis]